MHSVNIFLMTSRHHLYRKFIKVFYKCDVNSKIALSLRKKIRFLSTKQHNNSKKDVAAVSSLLDRLFNSNSRSIVIT